MEQKQNELKAVQSIESKQAKKAYEPPEFIKNQPLDSVSYVYYYYSYWFLSPVGTTIRKPENVPGHLAADEKHTRLLGDQTYLATIVAVAVFLGTAAAKDD